MQLFAHADADCFYVSCERVRDPRLIGKPVAVLGNQGACVIAISYEMKASGVQVSMPIWTAKKLCPDGIFIKRDFRWYGLLSHAMQEVFNQYSDQVEYYSIDESFMSFNLDFDEAKQVAIAMQKHMLQATGLPISVGFARTRTLCKLASKRNKPFGTLIINEQNREAILQNTDVQTVNGIGNALGARANALGIHSAWDYSQAPRELIKQHFHKPGETIWYELQSHPILKVNPERAERKVVSRGGSIWGHHKDPDYIWGFLVRNLERFLACLWEESIEINKLSITLGTSDGREFKHTETLPYSSNEQMPIFEALKKGFAAAYKTGPSYSHVQIIGNPTSNTEGKQLNLFTTEDPRSNQIKQLKVELNQRFGIFTLRNASTASAVEVFKDKVSDFEIVDVAGKYLFS